MQNKLWEIGVTFLPTKEQLEEIANFLAGELAKFLGQEIAVFQQYFVSDGSFTYSIRNKELMGGPFSIQWEALLVLTARRSGPPYIQAFFSLFSDQNRLQLLERGTARRTFILSYQKQEEKGQWVKEGWSFEDDFDFETTLKKPRVELYEKKTKTYG